MAIVYLLYIFLIRLNINPNPSLFHSAFSDQEDVVGVRVRVKGPED